MTARQVDVYIALDFFHKFLSFIYRATEISAIITRK